MSTIRDYAILYIGGRVISGGAIVGGGNVVLDSGVHALDGPEHTDLDAYVKATLAGQETRFDNGSVAGTATLDVANGNYHLAELTADCEFAIAGGATGFGLGFIVRLSGEFLATWDGAIVTNDTDPATGDRFWVFVGDEGDTTWFAFLAGGDGGSVAALDDLSDVTIASPADLQRLHYDATSSQWVNTSAIWRPLMDGAGNVITDGGTGEAIMALS